MATEYTLSLNDLLKDTLPELPGVVRSVAERELRLTLREFFEKTYAWTTHITGVACPAGEVGIQFDDGDDNTEVISVLSVHYGSAADGFIPLRPIITRPVDEKTASSPDAWYVNSNPDEVTLYPYLTAVPTKTLSAWVALIPAFDIDAATATLPRQITLKYYDAIMEGFLARMYDHPNKPYSNPLTAAQKKANFFRAMGYYAAQRKNGYNGSQSWSYPTRGWK